MEDRSHPSRGLADKLQTFDTAILLAIASGQVDPIKAVKRELADRGLDKNGRWMGFSAAYDEHVGAEHT